jgi:hypothetical protein
MDPFALLKLPLCALAWWQRRVGTKWLVVGLAASTLAVLILGCRETYG